MERIHVGGMAHLWRVTRDDMSPPAILKAPIIQDGDDATAIVGFEMEQMILPLLHGPHAPKFIASGDFSRQPYIVMEHIAGESLLGCIDHAPLPIDDVVEIGVGVAHALADLHSQNVIHLDVKPSNVIRRAGGGFALIDFGLSRHDLLPDLLAEEFRLPLGTGPYLSPEQILRDRTDPRSDMFALGVMLYFLLTGVRPFGSPRQRRALARRLWRDPEPPVRHRPDCPPWLQEVILHCLEPEADKRYPTAAQLALDLAEPEQIRLTERAEKRRADSWLTARRRWWAQKFAPMRTPRSIAARRAAAPIVMAALDLGDANAALGEVLRDTVARIMAAAPGARLACVSVIKTSRLRLDSAQDEFGRNLHVRRLVEARRWAAGLGLPSAQITAHVLEASDPAAALIDFARENFVDQIVICACSGRRGGMGPVAARIGAQAPCTVTLVRPPQPAEAGAGDEVPMEPDVGLGI
ncbi:bifunctional serine/threonine-protein kinase/universal stress protein [Rhodoblastus acidophilus]|uniref:Bifunctional serine/threonine-protein kinase/universal stress protein n=1 Tax=Candidatus Rhodoblastus alkanivorans TaxID=2954117 RepID=A0ABS9Z5D1_9HYPH|nr:bifunctional serine/threonine-protein kinase/universal stress protein [Candidatus Rhodoblastus alkanivorans]MCI4677693.1 bifunctional serine/threonine-protein kinase/universal stress protein [Candidatus Rhodoblastus alkanivorans]MCI4682575.1 bifunctional serine/threonine-protein kinase/universal stress protein [Candidatus Rhodoblastus alkanivorans]